MKNYLVFDIEIIKTIKEVQEELKLADERMSFGHPQVMGFAVGVLYDSSKNIFRAFKDANEFANYLLDFKGILVSFNGIRFDLPCLLKHIDIDIYHALQKKPHLDMLAYFYEKVNGKFRVSLDNLAKNTINKGKTGNGADAPLLFRQGKLGELIDYCQNDVIITKEVFEFGLEHDSLNYFDSQTGKVESLEVDFKKWLN